MNAQDYNVVIDRRAARVPNFAGWPRLDVRVKVRGADEERTEVVERITEVLREAIRREAQDSSAVQRSWRRLLAVAQKARLGFVSSVQTCSDAEANLLVNIATPRLKLDGPKTIPEPPDLDAQKVAKHVAAAGVTNACICAVVGGPGGRGYDLNPSTAITGSPLPAGQNQYVAAISSTTSLAALRTSSGWSGRRDRGIRQIGPRSCSGLATRNFHTRGPRRSTAGHTVADARVAQPTLGTGPGKPCCLLRGLRVRPATPTGSVCEAWILGDMDRRLSLDTRQFLGAACRAACDVHLVEVRRVVLPRAALIW
jgi:hypothetical protein